MKGSVSKFLPRLLVVLAACMALALGPLCLSACVSKQQSQDVQAGLSSSTQASSSAMPAKAGSDSETSASKDATSTSTSASSSSGQTKAGSGGQSATSDNNPDISEDGTYTSKDEVALYIHTYGHLPDNFISKSAAKKRGWVSSKGNLDEVCPGMSIGGSQFYNDEGQLPDKKGRTWKECDIGYEGGYRGAERIVFSNDGLIFYTGDHYKTFEQLY